MDTHSTLLTIAIFVLLGFSAFFSSAETAYTSLNKIRMKSLANDGNKRASKVLAISENYDKFITTILVGNNIVNILAASLGTLLFTRLLSNVTGESIIALVSTAALTILTLLIGEISPKTLAKAYPEKWALKIYPIIKFFMLILTPITFLFRLWNRLMSNFTKNADERAVTEDELVTIVEEAENDGEIDEHESTLIKNAIEFNDVDVNEIVTPRVSVEAVDEEASFDDIAQAFLENGFSRMPVYRDSIDHVVGVVHEKDFFAAVRRGESDLKKVMSDIVYVTENTKISQLLQVFQRRKIHMAVVVDEYGGTVGIVTLEDIIEELVGEIWDEHDEVVQEFVEVSEKVYTVAASYELTKFFDHFNIDAKYDSSSVGGWVAEELGKIPEIGDKFTYRNLDIEVLKADYNRAVEIKVIENELAEEENEDDE